MLNETLFKAYGFSHIDVKESISVLDYLLNVAPGMLETITLRDYCITLTLKKPENLLPFVNLLSSNSVYNYRSLLDIVAVDTFSSTERYELIYKFNLIRYNHNCSNTPKLLFVKVLGGDFTVFDTLTTLFQGANWLEREAWDLFGIFFRGHPDLRRILTDYGFDGHPMRKDFPLTGYVEVLYEVSSKRVALRPVSFTQEFRGKLV